MKTIALIDGDIFAYESAAASEQKFNFGDTGEAGAVDVDRAVANLHARIKTVKEACEADEVEVALSCDSRRYFRHGLWPEYKAGRPGHKPAALPHVRSILRQSYTTHQRDGLEADDILGILGTKPGSQTRYVIVTSDKDLLQIPGSHLNHAHLEHGIFDVLEEEGDEWHLFQTLTGDRVDNYPGCPGIGPVKAKKIVRGGWEAVEEAFEERGKTKQEALVQARVARILRWGEWSDGEVKLWSPKSE